MRSRPSAIWWKTSTMTASLMVLAVGKRRSAFAAIASPVSRCFAATPITPRKPRSRSLSRASGAEGAGSANAARASEASADSHVAIG